MATSDNPEIIQVKLKYFQNFLQNFLLKFHQWPDGITSGTFKMLRQLKEIANYGQSNKSFKNTF